MWPFKGGGGSTSFKLVDRRRVVTCEKNAWGGKKYLPQEMAEIGSGLEVNRLALKGSRSFTPYEIGI